MWIEAETMGKISIGGDKMVKGISRQVIVVHPTDQKLFEQAIFILSDEALGRKEITDDMLLKEANRFLRVGTKKHKTAPKWMYTSAGALIMAVLWLISALL